MHRLARWLVLHRLRRPTVREVRLWAASGDVPALLIGTESPATAVRRRAVAALAEATGPEVEAVLQAALADRARSVAEAADAAIRAGHPGLVPEADLARSHREEFAQAQREAATEPVETSLIGPDRVGRRRSSRRKVLDHTQSRGHYGAGF